MTAPTRSRLLWILRHAKAVVDPPAGGADHDRALRPRGRRDAEALARRLGPDGDQFGLGPAALPQLVLCSTARRTMDTATQALAQLDPAPPVAHLRLLYAASPEGVLDELRVVDDEVRSVMVVGHNPTMQLLAIELADTGLPAPSAPSAPGEVDRGAEAIAEVAGAGFPTCALAVYRLPIDRWEDLAEGTGTLLRFVKPPY